MTVEPIPDDIALDTAAYRRALGAFATGVCVVTASTPSGALGITINSFSSVSLKPRLVQWCLDERSERWPVFAAADRFAIHILGAEARDLAARFARGVCEIGADEFERDASGLPRLAPSTTRFACRVHDRIQLGDHLMIVGEVTDFSSQDGHGLVFHRGHYGSTEGFS